MDEMTEFHDLGSTLTPRQVAEGIKRGAKYRLAESQDAEITRLRARVAELESTQPPAAGVDVSEVLNALRDCVRVLEACEVQHEGEWGVGRTLAELERDGALCPELVTARRILTAALRTGGGES